MTLLVPFDGSDLSKAALVRAAQFDTLLDEGVIAVTVIPKGNAKYAREQGWIDETEQFDAEAIVSSLRATVADIAPNATFRYEFVDRYAPSGGIASRLRRFARDNDTSIAFIGSENAGRIVTGFTVGAVVSADRNYDTMIINSVGRTPVKKLEAVDPADPTG
jgi:nucleotide-binding universal stress UspA family protein